MIKVKLLYNQRSSFLSEVIGCDVDLDVGGFDAGHEHSVTVHELGEGVSDGVPGPPDADGLHHARVAQLSDTQLSVE